MRQEPRLQFTKEERADPALEKPIRKADRAADKAEKARVKIPKKKIRFEETVTDPATGKTVTRLRFEEVDKKKPPSKLSHAVRDAPGNAVLSKVHKEIRESEEDNVGVESARKMEEAAETGGRMIESAYHSHKLKPYREAAKAEKKLEKANINALGQYQCPLPQKPAGQSPACQQSAVPVAAKARHQEAVCRCQACRPDRRQYRQSCGADGKDCQNRC